MKKLTARSILVACPLSWLALACSSEAGSGSDSGDSSDLGGSPVLGIGGGAVATGGSGSGGVGGSGVAQGDGAVGGGTSSVGGSGQTGGPESGTGANPMTSGGSGSVGTATGGSGATGGVPGNASGGTVTTSGGNGASAGASDSSGGPVGNASGGRWNPSGGVGNSTGGTGAVTGGPSGGTESSSSGGSATSSGGTPGSTGGTAPSTDGTQSSRCEFSVTQSMSEVIPTVGIVEWSLDSSVDSAHIEFGLDESYGMTAPVDLAEQGYRTLLLGMKTSRSYHFRIVATTGGRECVSADYSLTTGAAPSDWESPSVTTPHADQLSGGYLITGRWGTGFGGPSFILDADTDIVWWYPAPDDVMRTRFSYDGKWMWMRNTAQTDGTGLVRRVSLDGLIEEQFPLPSTTHDLAVLPDGHLGLLGHTDGCDEILDFNPEDGSLVSVYNLAEAHGNTTCHANFVGYTAADDTFVVSDWENDCYVKVKRSGELVWILNGEHSSFQGTSWSCQHALHEIEPGHVLLFNNGGLGTAESSVVWEYQLDQTNWTATELWRYDAGITASFGGDVQRLANGNTMIAYSSAGVIQELNAAKELVQELEWPLGYSVGYIMKEDSLYGGPPPRM